MRVLSIDFDYFIDTTMEIRELNFPDGKDNIPPNFCKYLWDRCYSFFEGLDKIGVIEDYDKMCKFLKNLKSGRVLIADSHREIQRFFDEITSESLEIINIDFHHDMYVTGGETLDCGNWLRFLVELSPDADVTWVLREDSCVDSLTGTFPYYCTTDLSEVQGEFDLIFLCFSPEWTPPHLRNLFEEMCLNVSHLEKFDI